MCNKWYCNLSYMTQNIQTHILYCNYRHTHRSILCIQSILIRIPSTSRNTLQNSLNRTKQSILIRIRCNWSHTHRSILCNRHHKY